MKEVRIHAAAVPGKSMVRFSVDRKNTFARTVKVCTHLELSAEYRLYKVNLVERYPEIQISVERPNLFREFLVSRPKAKTAEITLQTNPLVASNYLWWPKGAFGSGLDPLAGLPVNVPALPPAPEADFEVNMMEALVGWKGWNVRRVVKDGVDYGQMLWTHSYEHIWPVDNPLEAKCTQCGCPQPVPRIGCTCGIYAADERTEARKYGTIFGQIYGWGRYVRGSAGWRAQYCYPKMFLLREEQADLIEPLKAYHCKIYVETPTKMYDPVEDGYESQGGNEDANWNDQAHGISEPLKSPIPTKIPEKTKTTKIKRPVPVVTEK